MVIATKKRSTFLIIVLTGFLTGTLDALAAIIWAHKVPPAVIFDYIASGAFGKAAYTGGAPMLLWGILFHYIIAYAFTIVFYLGYPTAYKISQNKYVTGLIYGMVTWIIMNLFVVPLSKIDFKPFLHVWPVVIGIGILILCVGMPVAIIADWQRRKRSR
ncbi:hypothetical protein [Mucilaginibacter sp.]|uniref:hypothetical protein n=1 Tax=Mucilaginibacter sp. TaxID=1882438 RepID=UPI0025DB6022|nr:hypothetical protein [Mucilaginibacter sp.]